MRRLIALGLAVVFSAGGCARPQPATGDISPIAAYPTPSASESIVECPASGVVVTEGLREAAMGLRVTQLNLINCGAQPYTVQGHPSLRLFDDDGDPLEVTVLTDVREITASLAGFDGPPARVTAAPGERLVAAVVWRNLTDSFDPTANVSIVEVTPAASEPAQRIRLESAFDLGNTGRLAVTAWRKAPDPPLTRPSPLPEPPPSPTSDPLL